MGLYFLLVADVGKVGCVIESHSCLRRFAIYVGHMLPRLLQLAVKYWTSYHASGLLQQLSCPQSSDTGQMSLICFLYYFVNDSLWTWEKQFQHLLLGCSCNNCCSVSSVAAGIVEVSSSLYSVFFKACACELLLWHIWSLGVSRDSWLTSHLILKLLPNNHTHFQYPRWLVVEHLTKNKTVI